MQLDPIDFQCMAKKQYTFQNEKFSVSGEEMIDKMIILVIGQTCNASFQLQALCSIIQFSAVLMNSDLYRTSEEHLKLKRLEMDPTGVLKPQASS